MPVCCCMHYREHTRQADERRRESNRFAWAGLSLHATQDAATAVWALVDEATSSNIVGQHAAYAFDDAGGRVVSFGGVLADGSVSATTAAFNVAGGSWSQLPAGGPGPRHHASFGVIDRTLIVAGGLSDVAGAHAASAVPSAGRWCECLRRRANAPFSTAVHMHCCRCCTGSVAHTDIWGLDLDSDTWSVLSNFAPAAIDSDREPAAVLGWSRQVRLGDNDDDGDASVAVHFVDTACEPSENYCCPAPKNPAFPASPLFVGAVRERLATATVALEL